MSRRPAAHADEDRALRRRQRDAGPAAACGRPSSSTFPEDASEQVANALAEVIDEHGGWYSHFNTGGETFVIYAQRIFRYPSGDAGKRAEAAEHGRSVGVPGPQLDWDEYE